VADEHVRKMAMLEFVRVVLVIGLARQQSAEDRIPANGGIGAPFLRQSRRPQRATLQRMTPPCSRPIPLPLSAYDTKRRSQTHASHSLRQAADARGKGTDCGCALDRAAR